MCQIKNRFYSGSTNEICRRAGVHALVPMAILLMRAPTCHTSSEPLPIISRLGFRLHSRKRINRRVKIAGEVSGRLGVHIESGSAILLDRHQSRKRRLFEPIQ